MKISVVLKTYKGYIHEDKNGCFTFVNKEKATVYTLENAHSKAKEIYNKIPFSGKIEHEYIK